MIEFGRFYQQIATGPLASWLEALPAQIAAWQRENLHGHFRNWEKSVDNLPLLVPQQLDLLHSVSAQHDALTDRQRAGIETLLRNLMPWRKGPFSLYGVRHRYRMALRLEVGSRAAAPFFGLTGRTVLDVGCGSGYHLWRMIGAGAQLAVGIDPMQLFLCQFEAVRKLLGDDRRAHLLPLGIEQLPAS